AFGFSSKVAYMNISYIQVFKAHIYDYLRNHSNLRMSFKTHALTWTGGFYLFVSLRFLPSFFDGSFSSLGNEVCCLNFSHTLVCKVFGLLCCYHQSILPFWIPKFPIEKVSLQ